MHTLGGTFLLPRLNYCTWLHVWQPWHKRRAAKNRMTSMTSRLFSSGQKASVVEFLRHFVPESDVRKVSFDQTGPCVFSDTAAVPKQSKIEDVFGSGVNVRSKTATSLVVHG